MLLNGPRRPLRGESRLEETSRRLKINRFQSFHINPTRGVYTTEVADQDVVKQDIRYAVYSVLTARSDSQISTCAPLAASAVMRSGPAAVNRAASPAFRTPAPSSSTAPPAT